MTHTLRILSLAAGAALTACSAAADSESEEYFDGHSFPVDATCGQIGGTHCDNGDKGCQGEGTQTVDCQLCCGMDSDPTCGQLGGDVCDQGDGSCHDIGQPSSDCDMCCGGALPTPTVSCLQRTHLWCMGGGVAGYFSGGSFCFSVPYLDCKWVPGP